MNRLTYFRLLAAFTDALVAASVIYYSTATRTLYTHGSLSGMSSSGTVDLGTTGLTVGILLLLVAGVSVWGAWPAFPVAIILSAASLLAFIAVYAAVLPIFASMALCVTGIALNAVVARMKPKISEEANPLNLPVFG